MEPEISRDRMSFSFGNRPHHFKQRVPEMAITERKLEIERKTFMLALKENRQGRFCRITEDANGWRNAVVVPASGLSDFVRALSAMAEAAKR